MTPIAPDEVEHGNDFLILRGQRFGIQRKIDELNYVLIVGLVWRDDGWHFVDRAMPSARSGLLCTEPSFTVSAVPGPAAIARRKR